MSERKMLKYVDLLCAAGSEPSSFSCNLAALILATEKIERITLEHCSNVTCKSSWEKPM